MKSFKFLNIKSDLIQIDFIFTYNFRTKIILIVTCIIVYFPINIFIKLIERIKAKVESLWMVYRSWEKERINATNIRTSKAFENTAKRFNMTSEQLAFAVIDASMKDKFRSWKINNCEMIYRHYARIINENMKQASAIWVLPWA